ncbi:Crp/Fnr family transcriptional regulator [Comamonas aquatilis]|uniref:Crp/Fnr family transcriptional regulator n=1 Tax=Comamonas aquatilis TaxID=1778406 RepID=UPI0039EF5D57
MLIEAQEPTSELVAHSSSKAPVAWQGLRNVNLLESLSDEKLAELATQCHWHRLEAGQVLHGPYLDQRLYMLIHGGLNVGSYTPGGRGLILGQLQPGVFFGGLAPQDPLLCVPVTVEATQPSLVASLSKADLEALIMSEVQVMRAVIERLSELAATLARRVVNLGTLSVRGRLHAQLLEQAERAGIEGDEALLSPAPLQHDLALMLGTSREEVAREMSRLTRLGLLQREGRDLRICHVDGLRVLLEESR